MIKKTVRKPKPRTTKRPRLSRPLRGSDDLRPHPETGRPVMRPPHVGAPRHPAPHPIDGIPHRPPHKLPIPHPPTNPQAWVARTIRLQFIATTNTITFNPALLTPVVNAMNAFFSSGKLDFVYDPARDFIVSDNTLLDQDWELLDENSLSNPESLVPNVDVSRCHAERQRVAAEHIGKLVVYISLGSQLVYSGAGGWAVEPRSGHYSSAQADYVATAAIYWRSTGGSIDPNTLAHEIGHYLHLHHPFYHAPKTVADAADLLRTTVDSWGWNPNDAPRIFDADLPFITDTAPDPAPDLFATVNGDACGPPNYIDVPVVFVAGNSRTYRLEPDRTNLMSYFKGCPGPHGFSTGQYSRMRIALERGNRNHLLTGYASWVPAPPALVPAAGNRIGVLLRDVTSSPWYEEWLGESTALNPGWQWLGGYVQSLSAVADSVGNVDAVASDFRGRVFHKSRRAGPWAPNSAWTGLGAQSFAGAPVITSWGPGRFDVFVCANSGALNWKSYAGTGWPGTWRSLGGNCVGRPAVACWGANRIDVVAWQKDRSLAHLSYDGTTWTAWQSLGGTFNSPPALASWGNGRLDVVARGGDNAIYHRWFAGVAWNGSWEYLGGNSTGTPALAAVGGNWLDIVARAQDGALWHTAWNGGAWVPGVAQWRPLGGFIVDSPATISVLSGSGRRLEIFARAKDGSLLHSALDAAGNQSPGAMRFTEDMFPTIY